jgi:hypothetical protein
MAREFYVQIGILTSIRISRFLYRSDIGNCKV